MVGGDRSVVAGVIHGQIQLVQAASQAELVAQLRAEIKELAQKASIASDEASASARTWNRAHMVLGLPTAVIAAVSGATALASTAGRIPAGILALCAAAMSAAAGFLGSEAKSVAGQQRAAALATLATDARILAAYDLEGGPAPQFRQRLIILADRLEAIRANDFEAARALKTRSRDYD
jgi:hypothetical protein